jgi:hypothetical protein
MRNSKNTKTCTSVEEFQEARTLEKEWHNLSLEKKQKALFLLHGELISRRTKAALQELRKTRKLGRPPFGYQFVNGKLVSRMDQSITLGRIHELDDLGYNANQIMTMINAEGHRSQTGKDFSRNVVALILSRFHMECNS